MHRKLASCTASTAHCRLTPLLLSFAVEYDAGCDSNNAVDTAQLCNDAVHGAVDPWADVDLLDVDFAGGEMDYEPLWRGCGSPQANNQLAPPTMATPLSSAAALGARAAVGANALPVVAGPAYYDADEDIFAAPAVAAEAVADAAAELLWSPAAGGNCSIVLGGRAASGPLDWAAEFAAIRSQFYAVA